MQGKKHSWRQVILAGGVLSVLGACLSLATLGARDCQASGLKFFGCLWGHDSQDGESSNCVVDEAGMSGEFGGTWYWLRSPEDEHRVIAALYNRYCIRCHGVDGRGVWDIPDVPNFTNARWQACRSDGQLARSIIEGRGAVMPPFRGTLTLEEAWAMARYLRSFLPEAMASRPDYGELDKDSKEQLPPPRKSK